jgi:site-specific recombinase
VAEISEGILMFYYEYLIEDYAGIWIFSGIIFGYFDKLLAFLRIEVGFWSKSRSLRNLFIEKAAKGLKNAAVSCII